MGSRISSCSTPVRGVIEGGAVGSANIESLVLKWVDILTGEPERLGAGERCGSDRLWSLPGRGISDGVRMKLTGGRVIGFC